MVKIFTLLNVAGLFLFNLLFVGNVSIVQEMPAKIDPGTEVRVSVTINKDKISGFAKLQLDLPSGLTATAIETRGASFTFADGKAKFIWMALPTQPSFKVTYTLRADANAVGPLQVTGRLSYIEDNERKTVDMPPSTITVGDGSLASTPPSPDQQPSVSSANTEVESPEAEEIPTAQGAIAAALEQSVIPDIAVTDAPSISPQTGTGDVTASRVIIPVNASEMLVEVTIKKGLLRGFGKLQETLPEGFTVVAKESDDAIFSTKGRVAKFVWLNLPSKEEMKVSYRLIAPFNTNGEYSVNGEFGYLMNDLTQRAVVGTTSFNVSEAIAASTPVKTPETKPSATTTTTATPQATTTTQKPATAPEPKVTKPTPTEHTTDASASRPSKAKITSTPAPESGITFKVQITAAHREVGKPYFVQRHRYDGDFSIERNDGWIKYVTGMFDRYNAARDQRQAYIDANYNFPGPFVTAYNNGERITVQEALMIAKQNAAQ